MAAVGLLDMLMVEVSLTVLVLLSKSYLNQNYQLSVHQST